MSGEVAFAFRPLSLGDDGENGQEVEEARQEIGRKVSIGPSVLKKKNVQVLPSMEFP